jgi:hypothetical protein
MWEEARKENQESINCSCSRNFARSYSRQAGAIQIHKARESHGKISYTGLFFPNTLVDLGPTINIMTIKTCNVLGITSFEPTSTMLELADRSVVKPVGTLQYLGISIDSWEYPTDFLVINPRSRLDGHPLILGQPWLVKKDAYIGCHTGNMTIVRGSDIKNLILYPLAKPSMSVIH